MSADEADSLVGRIARVLDEVRDDLCGFDAEEMSSAVLPIVAAEVRKAKAEAWDEAIRHSIECANETTDSWGNMYRLDWIARMKHEIEQNPFRATDIKEEN